MTHKKKAVREQGAVSSGSQRAAPPPRFQLDDAVGRSIGQENLQQKPS